MSDLTADNPKPWWKRWWGIVLIVLGVLLVIGLLAPDPEETGEEVATPTETDAPAETTPPEPAETTAEAAGCEDAPPDLVSAISEGLTVDGGGELENGKAVEVPDDLRNDRGWPVFIVGAQITGPGMDGVTGTWATSEDGGPIFALNTMAQEFSEWGSAANPGSPADQMRDMLANYDEADQAEECAAG